MPEAEVRYKKAPVSEVILGVTYCNQVLDVTALVKASVLLEPKNGGRFEILPPLANTYYQDGSRQQRLEPNLTGPFVLRVYFDEDQSLVQLQGNKVYFNWMRPDKAPVGDYPGFDNLLSRFIKVLGKVKPYIIPEVSLEIEYLELSYHDRLEWKKNINNLGELNKLVHVQLPPINSDPSNLNLSFTYEDKSESRFGHTTLKTTRSIEEAQSDELLMFSNTLIGQCNNGEIETWMRSCNVEQVKAFEAFFTPETLDGWRQ